jgi:hypothetical protein
MTKRLTTRISEIPVDGEWWKSSSEDTYQAAALKLRGLGMDDDSIVEMLTALNDASAGEFGA